MIYLKMMSGENIPDNDNSKAFRMVGVDESCGFNLFRIDSEHETVDTPAGSPAISVNLSVDGMDRICYYPKGNTYILNNNGKTIGSFAHMESNMQTPQTTKYPKIQIPKWS